MTLATSGWTNQTGATEEEPRHKGLPDELLTDIMGVSRDAQAKVETWENHRGRLMTLLRSAEGFQEGDAAILGDVVASVGSLVHMLSLVLDELGLMGETIDTETKITLNSSRLASVSKLMKENQGLRASLAAMHFEDAKRHYFQPAASAPAPENAALVKVASSGRGATYAPAPVDPRKEVIVNAASQHARESAGKVLICSQKAWVDQALRDAGQVVLTAGEVRDYSLGEEPQASIRKPAFTRSVNAARAAVETLPLGEQRPTIIKNAAAKYHSEEGVRKFCSHRAWVDNSLREADMGPLTEDETRKYSIQVDDWRG